MDTRDLGGKVALVTGAGSGIGRETALALGRAGATLVLCDVDADGLERTARDARALGRHVATHLVDVARREQMEVFAADVHGAHPAVDILVNNAGVGLGGRLVETPLADWEWLLGINLWGVIHGCHYFVPPMVQRGRGGHVVNVASAAGIAASSLLAAYSTSKFAVFGLSEALREELHPHGIGVTTVCPGIINTPITATSRLRGVTALPGARERMIADYQRRNYGPDRVAAAIVRAIGRNTSVLPVSPEAWFIYLVKRASPALAAWIGRTLTARTLRGFRAATD
ncbi:MAG: SDR family NAD(P)-dependent oxidoreductase [Candidatus Binatia bacterium]